MSSAFAIPDIQQVHMEETILRLRMRPYLVQQERPPRHTVLRCRLYEVIPPAVLAELHRMVN